MPPARGRLVTASAATLTVRTAATFAAPHPLAEDRTRAHATLSSTPLARRVEAHSTTSKEGCSAQIGRFCLLSTGPNRISHRRSLAGLTIAGSAVQSRRWGERLGERRGRRKGPRWPALTHRRGPPLQPTQSRTSPLRSELSCTTRRRNRTFQAGGCPALPVLKTAWEASHRVALVVQWQHHVRDSWSPLCPRSGCPEQSPPIHLLFPCFFLVGTGILRQKKNRKRSVPGAQVSAGNGSPRLWAVISSLR